MENFIISLSAIILSTILFRFRKSKQIAVMVYKNIDP